MRPLLRLWIRKHSNGFVPGVNGMNTALIYGHYYFTEALLRLQKNVLDGKPGWVLYSPTAVPESSAWAMMLLGFRRS